MHARVRTTLLLALVVAVAIAGTAGLAVAGNHAGQGEDAKSNGDRGNGGQGNQHSNAGDGSDNSTLDLHTSAGYGDHGGWLVIDCTSSGPPDHECDKDGALAIGPLTIDYDGFNFGDVDSMRGGGGDNVTASDGDRTVGGGFACDQGLAAPSGSPCTTSSTGP